MDSMYGKPDRGDEQLKREQQASVSDVFGLAYDLIKLAGVNPAMTVHSVCVYLDPSGDAKVKIKGTIGQQLTTVETTFVRGI